LAFVKLKTKVVRAKAHNPSGAGLPNFRKLGLYGPGWKAPPNAGSVPAVSDLFRGAPLVELSYPFVAPVVLTWSWVLTPLSRSIGFSDSIVIVDKQC